jgi:CBS domain containing-hemolysin-like protein
MITPLFVVMIAVICLAIEGFFSGAEIAMVSASRSKLRAKVSQGSKAAKLAETYLDSPQLLLSTTLLGTNLATVTFSVTVTVFLLQQDYGGGEFMAVLMVAPLTLVVGEVIPKTFFQARADDLVPKLIFPLHAASLILRPLIVIISAFARVVSRIAGGDVQRAFVTRQELGLLLDATDGEDADITEAEREMISNLLEMTEETVGNVMLPLSEVTAIPKDTTVTEAVREVADKQHSRMPVYEGRVDNIVGILHVFDLLSVGAHEREATVQSLARPVSYVPETHMAVDLLVELQGSGTPMAVVVDEYGGAVGIVTIEDLLEEVVGEIEDEHDHGPSLIVADQPGVWTIQAKASVARVNDELKISLPEDDAYESLAGLILHRLRRLPAEGETLVVDEFTLRVTAATNRSIEEIQLLRRRKR